MSKSRYCLLWGGLAWGLTTAIVFSLVMASARDSSFLGWLGISAPLFFLAGWLFWGPAMWRFTRQDDSRSGP